MRPEVEHVLNTHISENRLKNERSWMFFCKVCIIGLIPKLAKKCEHSALYFLLLGGCFSRQSSGLIDLKNILSTDKKQAGLSTSVTKQNETNIYFTAKVGR